MEDKDDINKINIVVEWCSVCENRKTLTIFEIKYNLDLGQTREEDYSQVK